MKRLFETVERNINQLVDKNVAWSRCICDEDMQNAKSGTVNLHLTHSRKIPHNWLPASLKGSKLLCLAGAGGQQAPLLAMAGADVTVLDLSEKMLEQDRIMAERYHLQLDLIHGNMCDMHFFPDNLFDIIINPSSLMYIPDVSIVYKECYRILKKGGIFILSAPAPVNYLCEFVQEGQYYKACNRMPYKSYEHENQGDWIEFGHTMEDYLGGLLLSGFIIKGYFEEQLEDITELSFVIKAIKP